MLQLKNICYDVVDGNKVKHILKNVNINIDSNTLTVVTGPNGSGKSTLAKIIMGLITPTSGQVIFNGVDVTNLSITERANMGMGYAFQQPITFKGITVKDLIDLATGSNNSAISACNYLSRVGLCAKDYVNREVNNKLSGGELKRIELATLLAKGAKLNICDEPEAGIDLWSFDALTDLFKDKTSTYLVISHQQRLIDIADSIIVLKNGKVDTVGTGSDVKHSLSSSTCPRLGGDHGQNR